jgi:hypothetical protein
VGHFAALCCTLLHFASLCFTLLHFASLCFAAVHYWEIVPSTEHCMVPLCLIVILADTETDAA